jgi:magnesium transporter
MFDILKRRTQKVGAPPGTLLYTGPPRDFPVQVTVLHLAPDFLEEVCLDPGEGVPEFSPRTLDWVRVRGIHDPDLIRRMGERFKLHPLLMEDLLNPDQRPKLEEFGDLIFIALKMVEYNGATGKLLEEQVGIIWGEGYVITFQEGEKNTWDHVAQRARREKSRIRHGGADYLVVALLDAVVDRYFSALSGLGEEIEKLEERLLLEEQSNALSLDLYHMKREMLALSSAIRPVTELVKELHTVGDGQDWSVETDTFLRDVSDHVSQVADMTARLSEMVSSMIELHISLAGMRMNEIMKVLTLIATIFIPLTFVAGIYGMNFAHMPELQWAWGYPAALLFMAALGIGMYWWFVRKKWL